MLKQSITYIDYNGQEVEEDLYFNLTKAEIIELEMSRKGGMSDSLKRVVESEDGRLIMNEFKNIIMISYGEKSEDGRRFIKSQELLDGFMSSEVYSEFFMKLMTEAGAAAEFIKGLLPADLVDEVVAQINAGDTSDEEKPKEPTLINRSELNTMSPNDKARVMMSVEKGEAQIVEDLQ